MLVIGTQLPCCEEDPATWRDQSAAPSRYPLDTNVNSQTWVNETENNSTPYLWVFRLRTRTPRSRDKLSLLCPVRSPGPQKLWEAISDYFKLLSLGLVYYAIVDNSYNILDLTSYQDSLCSPDSSYIIIFLLATKPILTSGPLPLLFLLSKLLALHPDLCLTGSFSLSRSFLK